MACRIQDLSPLRTCSVMSNSAPQWTVARQAPLSVGFFPGKNNGVGCHFLLQGIFPTHGWNPCLLSFLNWQADSLLRSHLGGPLNSLKVKWSKSEVTQLCPTLLDPIDWSLSSSSIHGILQAKILEWVTISSSRGSSWPRDQARVWSGIKPFPPALAAQSLKSLDLRGSPKSSSFNAQENIWSFENLQSHGSKQSVSLSPN